MAKVKRIVVHCTGTRVGDRVTRQSLAYIFFAVNGWQHWGYHAVVYHDGSWEILQQLPNATTTGGIITDATRANGAKGYNNDSLHVAYVGGLDRATRKPADTRTDEQKNTLRMLISYWKTVYKITEVVGHRDLPGVNKACPCFDAKTEYQNA